MKKFIIDKGLFSTRLAIIGKKGPEMINYEVQTDSISLGDIYIGKVKTINKSNNSAFLDIGVSNCYLGEYADDLKSGDMIIVQIDKEAHDDKLPSVVRDVSLLGKYTVFISRGNGVKYSRKTKNIEEIEILAKEVSGYLKGMHGLILRSNAKLSLEREVKIEIEKHISEYRRFEERLKIALKPMLLKSANKSYIEQLFKRDEGFEIITNSKEVIKEIKPYLREDDTVELNETSLFSIYGIGDEMILKKIYEFQGANIIIEKTEAMTVIDVNSGNKAINLNRDNNNLEINLALCDKIVELIILKNISGIIIIDFINMKDKKNKEVLINSLKKAFCKDYNQVKVMEITSLGLIQVTRKRKSEDVYSKFTQKCHVCNGTGRIDNELSQKIKVEEIIQFNGYRNETSDDRKLLSIFSEEEKKELENLYCRG